MSDSFAFGDYARVRDTNVSLGKGAGTTDTGVGNTIIGASAATSLGTASYNTVIGNGCAHLSILPFLTTAAYSSNVEGGYATVIGNGAISSATSSTSKVILIGAGATASASQTNVCVLGGQGRKTSITDYGFGHFLYMPIVTYTASATVTAADVLGGIIVFQMATSGTCTFPTQAQIFAAMKDPIVGSGFRLMLCKNGNGSLSISMGGIPQFRSYGAQVLQNNVMYIHYVVDDVSTPTFKIRGAYCTMNVQT